jgi:hypothetical protein
MLHLVNMKTLINASIDVGNIWADWLARTRGFKAHRRALLCLLCVFLGISMITTLWALIPPLKPALAQPDDEGTGCAEAHLGPGKRVQLPAIDNENGWETWIQVQNVGTTDSGVVVFFWGDYSEKCPANDPGPIDTACMRVPKSAVWTLQAHIPTQAKSAIAYSVATTVFGEACEDAGDVVGDTDGWQAWEDTYGGTGEPLAVIAHRKGTNDFGTVVSSAYPGFTESMMGEGPPYQYFTPYAMRRYHDLYTVMVIQNSGDQCTAISIYYKEQAPCVFELMQHIEQLAPGESIRVRVPDEINCEWLGSAYVQANEPLSIIVDQTSFSKYCVDSNDRGTLLTYWAQPYKPASNTLAYANLLFRMSSGWQTGIQVQNLTQESLSTFVTVNFMDNSGGELIFLGDWVCPNGATTFFLPAITDLGADYVGAADIQSHKQVDYPGGHETGGQPIFAVVDVKKTLVYSDTFERWEPALPGQAQGGAYNADPLSAHQGWRYIALPSISKSDEAISTIAIRNNSNCNRIQLRINIHDATGAKQTIFSSLWLGPKQLRLVDLANIGTVASGFIGAGIVEVISEEQLCDKDGDGHIDPELVMPSAIVFNKGQPSGDITTVYDGIPYSYAYSPCSITISGHVIDQLTLDPINDASISIDGAEYATTDPTGYYSFEYFKTAEPITITVVASAADYVTGTVTLEDVVCDDQVVNFELYPECDDIWVNGTVYDKETGLPIADAFVNAVNPTDSETATTNTDGYYDIELAFAPDAITWVTAWADGYNGATDSVFIPNCSEAQMDFELHQTPKSRILLYYGNGGVGATDYYTAAALFGNLGYLVDYTDVWPPDPDLEEYKVIFLLGPGNANGDPPGDDFTPGQLAQLDLFLRGGGRLVVMAEAGAAVSVENALLDTLTGSDVQFVAGTISNALADDITADQVTTGAATLDFDTAISITVGAGAVPGELAALSAPHPNAGDVILAADTPTGVSRLSADGFAGDVVLIGDLNWMDDASFMGYVTAGGYIWPDWPADNENLLLNIIGF